MQELTLEQERKGLKKGINDYLCMSAAKKLSKTITFSDKKWSNMSYLFRNVRTRPTYLTTVRVNKRG